jgi:hypothetical protein
MEAAALAMDATIDNKIGFMTNSEFIGVPFPCDSGSNTKPNNLVDQIMGDVQLTRQTKKMKDSILSSYERDFGQNPANPIVTPKPGKHHNEFLPNKLSLVKNHPMKPSAHHDYEVEPSIEGAVFVLTKYFFTSIDKEGSNYEEGSRLASIRRLADFMPQFKAFTEERGWLDVLSTLTLVNKDFHSMITDFKRLLKIDITPLRSPRLNYMQQEEIPQEHVDMVTSLMIRADLHPGIAVRYISGEYTGEHRDPKAVINYIHGHVSPQDEADVLRILTIGTPHKFVWTEPRANKLKQIEIGNQKSVTANEDEVRKTMNKEHKFSHILSCQEWVASISPYCRHNAQGMNLKKGKARLVWDASTIPQEAEWLTVLNRISETDGMPAVSYGTVQKQFMLDILDWRASFPNEDIFIPSGIDLTAAFRYPRVHPDLTGALGFKVQGLYHLATSMVFGHVESAPSFEPFRRCIEIMSIVEFNNSSKDLEAIHKEYLDMLDWDTLLNDHPEPGELCRSAKCSIIKGVINQEGELIQSNPRIFVDDALLASIRRYIKRLIASVIEAIFNVLGQPNTDIRRNHLSMDKWLEAIINYRNILLGLSWNTRKLTVGIPGEYLDELRELIKKTRLLYRKTFTVPELSRIIGKMGRIGQAVNWVYHLMSHLYASASYALTRNRKHLTTNCKEFQNLLQVVKGKTSFEILGMESDEITQNTVSYAHKKLAQMPHRSRKEFPIVKTMKAELTLFANLLDDDSISWESPIAHMVTREAYANSFGDACLYQSGGFSIKLRFIWHLEFPIEIQQRTILHIKSGPDQIGINVLEFVAIIINYAAALTVILQEPPRDDPYPILLNFADSMSAIKWIRLCTSSPMGRRLGLIFCFLLMESPLGINAEWLPGDENIIADAISRIKQTKGTNKSFYDYDYSLLKQEYPVLTNCRSFQPSQELLSMLWTAILTENTPTLNEVRKLKQNGLGKLSI